MIPLLLTGPAGGGKTHRCLAEIAERLRAQPDGDPLILLAPRQATYQLERQILSFPGVEGFSRLRILSFQRLARFIFESTGSTEPKLLDEDGRVMALRAILGRRRDALRVYRLSAQHEGLAQELSGLWRELREHGLGPTALRAAAQAVDHDRLRAKLEDFAGIFEDYELWLKDRGLRDGDDLLDLAADAALRGPMPPIAGLWLDGFAQMTPQERRLLNAVLRACGEATLAFCLPARPLKPADGFSMWSVLARTYCELRAELTATFQAAPREETLPRQRSGRRFDSSPMLAHLEEHWGAPTPFESPLDGQVRVVRCSNPEAEASFAAREILKFVRNGGRFREVAVLVRSLDGSQDILRRVFHRYGIRFFMDRRESVGHHPLAELTRGALRTITFNWRHHDLFATLKSGLSPVADAELDWFENMALARGWRGDDWRAPLFCGANARPPETDRAERLRQAALRPIFALEKALGPAPTGLALSRALREFWAGLDLERKLDAWSEEAHEHLHTAVWTQMEEWLASIELAFADDPIPLAEWLGILDAGLESLTVGLIPPALDQTLIGAVDRSRNPDLKAVFLLGANEGLFPKPGKERLLLNDHEREALAAAGAHLASTSLWNLGAEQFYGYIACTRARHSLTVTFAETGADGAALNPSLFITHLQRLFPGLPEERFTPPAFWEAQAAHELNRLVFTSARRASLSSLEDELLSWPPLRPAWDRARSSALPETASLSPRQVEALFGPRLRTSVSRLEQFAMCPFRFFVSSGLHAEERLAFELDRREEGSFQHEVLKEFHSRVQASGRRWRDVPPAEGRRLIADIGDSLKSQFQDGLVNATPSNQFRAEARLAALQDFMALYLSLMRGCEFDPAHVELGFGRHGTLPPWIVTVDDRHTLEFSGRIDRVDVWLDPASKTCSVLVFDYKSSKRNLDRRLVEAAIQQQLPAYLAALEKIGAAPEFPFPVKAAGAFYVNLALPVTAANSRREAMADQPVELKQAGVFDLALLPRIDPTESHTLFDYPKNPSKSSAGYKSLPQSEFADLVQATEARLRTLGARIFSGDIAIDPFRKTKDSACGHCLYAGVCRIDPWTHSFRKV